MFGGGLCVCVCVCVYQDRLPRSIRASRLAMADAHESCELWYLGIGLRVRVRDRVEG